MEIKHACVDSAWDSLG